MEKLLIIFIGVIMLFFSYGLSSVDARSGCCSHHGGVCGCRCCDGTALSATCAPYYPECNTPSTKITSSTTKYSPPITENIPPTTNDNVSSITSFNSFQSTVNPSNDSNKSYLWLLLIGGGTVGIILYRLKRKK